MLVNVKNLVVLLVTTVVVTGCSSSGSYTIKTPIAEPLNGGKTVSVTVKSDKIADQNEETQNVTSALKERLLARLVSEGLFKNTVIAPNKGDYDLEVNISGIRIVSTAARIAFGVMAGPSSIETEVLLKDSASNRTLAEYNVTGSSAAHPLSSEAGYENAVREAANNIVAAMKK